MSHISKCQAYLKSNPNKQCSNKALSGEIYCGIHIKIYGPQDQLKTELQQESKIQEAKELKNLQKIEQELGLDYLDPDSINILYGYLSLEQILAITKDNKYIRDKIIKTSGLKFPSIDKASRNGDLETVKYLVEIGKNPTKEVLYDAIKYNHLDIVKYLVLERHMYIHRNVLSFTEDSGHPEIANFLRPYVKKSIVIKI